MALSCKGGDERTKAVYSPIGTLTSSPSLYALPLPTLPFELIEEILSRLPVKLLLQLRCSCKSWNSLISDPKFAKKHLSLSTTHNLHRISYSNKYIIKSYPLDSIFTTITATNIAQSYLPFSHSAYFIGSCNGILCLADDDSNSIIVRLWNPSIRKDKELHPLQEPKKQRHVMRMYGFGYDPVGDNYKVVVVLRLIDYNISNFVDKYKVKVLGTSSWENISNFPLVFPLKKSGQFVSGTINWLASKDKWKSQCFVVALDLGSGSYQEVLLPDDGEVHAYPLLLTVLRDCLCIVSGDDV